MSNDEYARCSQKEKNDEDAREIVGSLSEPFAQASRASLCEMKSSAGCAGHVSDDMAWQLKIFGIEHPADINRKWAPTICMVPEELKKGDDNGCYEPVAVLIGLCRGLPAAEKPRAGPAPVQLNKGLGTTELDVRKTEELWKKLPRKGLGTTELDVRKTEELWKKLPQKHRDLERYKSSCVVQLFVSRPRPDKKPAKLMEDFFSSMRGRRVDIIKCHSKPYVYPGRLYGSLELETLRTLLIDGCFILHRLLKYAYLADREEAAAKKPGGSEEGNCWIQTGGGRCFAFVWQLLTRQTPPVQQGDDQGSNSEVDDDYDYGDDDWSQTRGRCFVWQLVTRDLLLLENQIPFFVLVDLFEKLKKDGESPETLVKGGLMLFRALCPQMLPDSVPVSVLRLLNIANEPYGVHHLLHLFYLLVGGKELKHSAGPGDNNDDPKEEEEGDVLPRHQVRQEPRGLTDVLPSELPQWIPGAKELLEAGIRLRKRKKATSFLDIKFDIRSGVLEIPPLQLYDYSEPVFRNMIAFEQTYPRTQFHVSTYSVFMNCLVSTAEDARILHLRGILVNMMNGGDQDGGRHFFDRICSHVHFPSKNYLVDTMAGVNKYRHSRCHKWRAALVRDYFSNPWVAISVVAAVFLLCLTVLQTVFTVYPYFKPSK